MGEVIYLAGIEQARGCLQAARTAEENGEIAEAVALLEMHAALMQKVKVADAPAIRVRGRWQFNAQPAGMGRALRGL